MQGTLAYAASLAPKIADGPDAVDDAMRGGYGWSIGPFEMIDRLGPDWLAGVIAASGETLPPYLALAAERGGFHSIRDRIRTALLPDGGTAPRRRTEGALSLGELTQSGKPFADNGCAALWDIGEGVACLEIRTKMNTLSPPLLELSTRLLTPWARTSGPWSSAVTRLGSAPGQTCRRCFALSRRADRMNFSGPSTRDNGSSRPSSGRPSLSSERPPASHLAAGASCFCTATRSKPMRTFRWALSRRK